MTDIQLLPCPFCGGPATFEECVQGSSIRPDSCTWSVGCANEKIDCIGYQMLAHYDRKSEAAEAWNRRVVPINVTEELEHLRRLAHVNELIAKQLERSIKDNGELRQQLTKITEDRDDFARTFDLRWKADMRAIKRWQAAHPGNDLVWPDHADLVVWLMEQLENPKG